MKQCSKCGLMFRGDGFEDQRDDVCKKCKKRKGKIFVFESESERDPYFMENKEFIEEQIKKAMNGELEDKPYINQRRRIDTHEYTTKQKNRARSSVQSALKSGRIRRKKCEVCFSTKNIEAHHWSYSRQFQLNVVWLCRKCHNKLHSKNK